MSTEFPPNPDELQLLDLLQPGRTSLPALELNEKLNLRLRFEIKVALDSIDEPLLFDLFRTIFDEILRVFDRLFLIEHKLNELDSLLENLSILEVLQFEIRYLNEFINTRAMSMPGVSQRLIDTFDGISYGMSHDVKRVFERELTSDIRTKSIPVVYGTISHAHGLLTNCFQQTLITLLQALNPKLDPTNLFDDFEQRLRQTLILCNDLSVLMRVVKQAETEGSSQALEAVVDKALEFRDGSMQYLMYRDWRGYEHHALAVVTSIQDNLDSIDLLHRFGCYLEVLYGHVKMRAVLKDLTHGTADGSNVGG